MQLLFLCMLLWKTLDDTPFNLNTQLSRQLKHKRQVYQSRYYLNQMIGFGNIKDLNYIMEKSMKNNKPKYNFFKNTSYAIDGFIHAIKTETSFKIELILSIFIILAIVLLPLSLSSKLALFITGILVLIVELLNSAIENVVDLVTKDVHPLAKSAKDIGATSVMFAIGLHVVCWVIVLLVEVF